MIGLECAMRYFHIKQVELADMLGVKKQSINHWVSRRQAIPKKYITKVATFLKVEPEMLQRETTTEDELVMQIANVSRLAETLGLTIGIKVQTK